MNRFKEGDRVKLVNIWGDAEKTWKWISSDANKVGNTGGIRSVFSRDGPDHCSYSVVWDNGEVNNYLASNLALIRNNLYKDE